MSMNAVPSVRMSLHNEQLDEMDEFSFKNWKAESGSESRN